MNCSVCSQPFTRLTFDSKNVETVFATNDTGECQHEFDTLEGSTEVHRHKRCPDVSDVIIESLRRYLAAREVKSPQPPKQPTPKVTATINGKPTQAHVGRFNDQVDLIEALKPGDELVVKVAGPALKFKANYDTRLILTSGGNNAVFVYGPLDCNKVLAALNAAAERGEI